MGRFFNIDQWLYQIEHLYQFRIIESPHNSLRPEIDISRTVLAHYEMLNYVELEAGGTIFMCRPHRGLKHPHSISIRTHENHICTHVEIRKKSGTEDSHLGLLGRDGADECVVDCTTEFGDVTVQAGLAGRLDENAVFDEDSSAG